MFIGSNYPEPVNVYRVKYPKKAKTSIFYRYKKTKTVNFSGIQTIFK